MKLSQSLLTRLLGLSVAPPSQASPRKMAKKMRKRGILATLALLGLVTCQSASAVPVTAWTLDSVDNFRNNTWSFGDLFTVGSSDISVTGLGAFDANLDGYVTPGGIEVGIFRESDNALLVSTFVQSGDILIGNYRFAAITPQILLANTQYRVVGVNDDDLYNVATGTPNNVDPRITWNRYGYCQTGTLTSCDQFTGTERTWMANFQLDSVPEPGSLALLALGLAGIGWRNKTSSS